MGYPRIETTEQRHVYITKGISREAFTATGVKLTTEDDKLTYYVHGHRHDPYGEIPCNDTCTVIHMGKVDKALVVTQSDDANPTTVD